MTIWTRWTNVTVLWLGLSMKILNDTGGFLVGLMWEEQKVRWEKDRKE